jgi:hypothetical protein
LYRRGGMLSAAAETNFNHSGAIRSELGRDDANAAAGRPP